MHRLPTFCVAEVQATPDLQTEPDSAPDIEKNQITKTTITIPSPSAHILHDPRPTATAASSSDISSDARHYITARFYQRAIMSWLDSLVYGLDRRPPEE
ncbi:uncharacterized protein BP5553_05963 [Venustampulla echinocandica]|uniref:Uncharacterized protein n=1 Tax=Venustampulla echinocandica TaxID=2656787 RepID=A0A370TM60_9HELO|nr:uncharacterized protein BP5553_05963 [Venustampulla echinocandica]RDL36611.1 hypothetical protein BP5553_05963 [Venustampulla echinocandica]